MKQQRGFLMILAALLIVVIGFFAIGVSYMLAANRLANNTYLQTERAYYIANSGIETANRLLVSSATTCNAISGLPAVTNTALGAGNFTVTGSASSASSTLNGAITATAATLTLASSSGFAVSGAVTIDQETITYTGVSGNQLTGLTRGAGGSAAAIHASAAAVSQTQCLLSATAGVPNLTSPVAKVMLQSVLTLASFSVPTGSGTAIPAAVSAGTISASGNSTFINPNVTTASAQFAGANVLSATTINTEGSFGSQVNSAEGLVAASSKSSWMADVMENNTALTGANLFGQFFTQSKATIQASANQSYDSSNISGVNGQTIWVTGDLSLNGGTIGTADSPDILIINGNLSLNGNVTINGFVYVTGTVDINGTASINGSIASESDMSFKGNSTITYSSTILSALPSLNSSWKKTYVAQPGSWQQVYY